MNTRQMIDEFIVSDFFRNNMYSHLQAGLPLPFKYKNGLGIRFLFHKMISSSEQIILFSPSFEICLVYPSCRLIRFSEIGDIDKDITLSISKRKTIAFKNAYERCYNACDELMDFFDNHSRLTPTVLKEYYRCLEKSASDVGMDIWYGGLYDNNSGI